MKNFTTLLKTLLLCAALVMIGREVKGVTIEATNTGNWNSTNTWKSGNIPSSTDDVIIQSGINVTVNISNAACGSLKLGDNTGNATIASLTFSSNTSSLAIGSGGLTIGLNKTNGTKVIGEITMTSGCTLSIGGSVTIINAVNWNPNSGNVVFNGSSAQTIPAWMATFNNLTLSGAAKTLGGNVTVGGTLTNSSSITAGSNTLTISGPFSNSGSFTAGTSTVVYNGGAAQTIAPFTYNNLTLSGSGAKTLGGNVTVGGTLTNSASITAGSNTLTISGSFDNSGSFTAGTSTVIYNGGAAQDIAALTYNNLTLSGEAKTLKGIVTIGSNLNIAGATFNTNNNALSLQGNFTNSGTFNAGSSSITFSGGISQNIAGFTTTGNVTVNKTAGVATLLGIANFANLTITAGNLTIPAGGQVTVSGETAISMANGLTIESAPESGAGTGSFITGSTSGAGTATVIRYMAPKRWHLVSSPLSEQAIGTFLTNNECIPYNTAPGAPIVVGSRQRGMRAYDVTSNSWGDFLLENSTEKLTTGKGFSMRVRTSETTTGTQRVTFTGRLQPGTHAVEVTPSGWNCIGNPYTSAIGIKSGSGSAADFLTVNAALLDPSFSAIYVWNQADGDVNNVEAPGFYKTISNATLSNSTFPISEDNRVQQGQAFMVKIRPLVSGETSLNITFNKDMQLHQPNLALKSTDNIWPTIQLQATANDINSSTTIAFHERMTNGLDVTYDAGLLKADSPIDLYTRLVDDYGIPFAIQALPSDKYDELIIPVGVDYSKGGQVSFSAKSAYLPSSCRPILEDRLTGIITDLSDKTYTADLLANTAGTGRFYLHTSYVSTGVDSQGNALAIRAWAVGIQEIEVNGKINKGAIASLYDLQGRLILTHVMREGIREHIGLPSVNPGIYLLKVQDQQKIQTIKVAIGQ